MSTPDFGGANSEKSVLLFLDEDYDITATMTFKSILIPLIFALCYLILLIWSILKDRNDKIASNKIDLKLASAISSAPSQTNITRPYSKWDPNRTQENWTNVTAMNATLPNTVTDREEDNSVSFVTNKSNVSNISSIDTKNYKRTLEFEENQKQSEVELSKKFKSAFYHSNKHYCY